MFSQNGQSSSVPASGIVRGPTVMYIPLHRASEGFGFVDSRYRCDTLVSLRALPGSRSGFLERTKFVMSHLQPGLQTLERGVTHR